MTKHLRFLIVLLMTLVWSTGGAQKVTLDFSKSTNPWKLPASSYSQEEKSYSYNGYTISFKNGTEGNGYMFTSFKKEYFLQMGKTGMTLVLPTFDFEVSKIVVEGHSSGNDKVTQNIFVAETPICTETKGTKGTNTYTIPDTYQTKGTVYKLKVTNANITRISSIKIYEKETTSTKTPTKVAFPAEYSNKTFTFTEGKLEGFTAPTATETNNVAGTITYSSNNVSAVKVNASTGALSFPGYGEATITATFTPTDAGTYAVSTDSYKVKNERGVVAGTITFDKANGAFENVKGSGTGYISGDFQFVSDSNESFTFKCSNVMKNDGCLQLQSKTDKQGKVESPTFSQFTNGYKVYVVYSSKSALTLKAGEYKATGTTTTSVTNDGAGADVSIEVPANESFVINVGSGYAKISKIEIIPNKVDEKENITLNESADNTIEAKSGVNVTLNRTMAKGVWNTICLPFGLTSEQITTVFGEGVKVAQLDDTSTGATLKFVDMTNIGIEASVPYLIKPVTDAPADGYKFVGVEITKTAVNPTKVKTAGGLYFNGVYNMVDATAEVTSGYKAAFLGKGNTVFGAQSGTNMKGFRAYFAIPTSVKASELRVVIDGTATSIKNIDSEVVESNAPVYNLQGQRVDGNNLTPGIYVKAGKKFVVK